MAKPTKLTEQQKADYLALTDEIQRIYLENGYDKKSINWSILTAQIKNIMADNKDWTYPQIKYALNYMYEIEGVNLFDERSNESILALLPFYFIKAKEFCLKQRDIINAVKEFDFNDEVIKIKRNTEDRELYFDDLSFD